MKCKYQKKTSNIMQWLMNLYKGITFLYSDKLPLDGEHRKLTYLWSRRISQVVCIYSRTFGIEHSTTTCVLVFIRLLPYLYLINKKFHLQRNVTKRENRSDSSASRSRVPCSQLVLAFHWACTQILNFVNCICMYLLRSRSLIKHRLCSISVTSFF